MNFFNDAKRATNTLRIIAILGVIFAAFYKLYFFNGIGLNQHYSFYALIIVTIGVLVSIIILNDSFRKIVNNPDFFVPIGLYIFADSLIASLIQLPDFIGYKDGRFSFENISLVILTVFLLQIIISVFFTGWITRTILDFFETEKVDLVKSLKEFQIWFPRTFAVIIFGQIPFLILILLIFPILFQFKNFSISSLIYPFILFIAVFSLIWNLATAVLVPHVLNTQTNLKEALVEGIKISWLNKKKTFLPVIIMMLVSGWIVFISVTYTEPTSQKKKFGEYSYASNYSMTIKNNFNAEFIWVGDYQESSKWHTAMMKAVKQEPLKTVSFRIMILMLILSLVVNFEIIGRYLGKQKSDGQINGLSSFKGKPLLIAGLFMLLFPAELFSGKLFNNKQQTDISALSVPKVFTDENILKKQPFLSSLYDTENYPLSVFVGNFDRQEENEKVVLYRDKAIIYNAQEKKKNEIKFNLGMTQDSNSSSDAAFNDVKVVDFDDDGKYDFIGIGSYPYTAFIVNQKGDISWKYQGKGIDIQSVEAIDIDDDKRKELVVIESNFIKIFNREGKEIKSIETKANLGFSSKAYTVKDDESDNKAILIKNFSSSNLINFEGKEIKTIKMPTNISGFLIEDDFTTHSLFFDDSNFGLFDLDGNLEAKYDAPFSEIKATYWDKATSTTQFERNFYVLSATAQKFKVEENGKSLFAVLATLVNKDVDAKTMLYVYDDSGRIVYQELFDDSLMELIVLPSETKIGTEDLILIENKNIWKFTTQH